MSALTNARKRLAELRKGVRESAENRPGVYRMLGPGGEVLYVGKSVHLRTRLLSYFRARRGEKAAEILAHAERIEWDYVASEFAALLHEMHTIKHWRPRFNVEHKRDPSHCFIKITREAAPRLVLVTSVGSDGARYYGPFRGRARVREALRELSDVLELRDCAGSTPMRFGDQRDLFALDDIPRCLRADLGRCLAPCAGRCTVAEYRARVELARRFLEGDADSPLSLLRERMEAAAARLQFEYAAKLRDRTARLEQVRSELVNLGKSLENLSFVYPVVGWDGSQTWYLLRRGRVRAEVAEPKTRAQWRKYREEVTRVYGGGPEGLQLEPHEAAEILLVARWFRLHPEERERRLPPGRAAGGKGDSSPAKRRRSA